MLRARHLSVTTPGKRGIWCPRGGCLHFDLEICSEREGAAAGEDQHNPSRKRKLQQDHPLTSDPRCPSAAERQGGAGCVHPGHSGHPYRPSLGIPGDIHCPLAQQSQLCVCSGLCAADSLPQRVNGVRCMFGFFCITDVMKQLGLNNAKPLVYPWQLLSFFNYSV